jgi:hypothetical protein
VSQFESKYGRVLTNRITDAECSVFRQSAATSQIVLSGNLFLRFKKDLEKLVKLVKYHEDFYDLDNKNHRNGYTVVKHSEPLSLHLGGVLSLHPSSSSATFPSPQDCMEKQSVHIIHYFNRTSLLGVASRNDSRRHVWCDTFMTLDQSFTNCGALLVIWGGGGGGGCYLTDKFFFNDIWAQDTIHILVGALLA